MQDYTKMRLQGRWKSVTVIDSKSRSLTGEMAEWLKAHAWKACIPQGIQGSNPCLSATLESMVYVEHRSVLDSKA